MARVMIIKDQDIELYAFSLSDMPQYTFEEYTASMKVAQVRESYCLGFL